jgi:hypothetical protein
MPNTISINDFVQANKVNTSFHPREKKIQVKKEVHNQC